MLALDPAMPHLAPLWRLSSSVRAHERAARSTPDRHGCVHCHRTPLVGETVYCYGERMVCELCRPLRREAPARSEVVHSAEHERAVRSRPRAA